MNQFELTTRFSSCLQSSVGALVTFKCNYCAWRIPQPFTDVVAEWISSLLNWLCSWEFAAALRDAKPKFDAAGFKLITIGVGPPSKAQVLAEKVVLVIDSQYCIDVLMWSLTYVVMLVLWGHSSAIHSNLKSATFCHHSMFPLWFLFVACGSYPFLLSAFMPILTTRLVTHWIGIGIYLAKYCFLYYWFSFICTAQVCPFYTQFILATNCC